MKSPFPGMDPYLEGYLWPDVQHDLSSEIRQQLASQISPKYVARINLYTVNDQSPEEEIGIMYPDVEVLERQDSNKTINTPPTTKSETSVLLQPTPATLKIRAYDSIEVKIPVVEIRDTAKNQLVTAIEILSPVNKKGTGFQKYETKRKQLIESGISLVEIDLLRRGKRIFPPRLVPDAHYMISLRRGGSPTTEIWAIDIKDTLPILPIPLRKPDQDALLDLGKALSAVYQRGLFHLSIDYVNETPPKPAFEESEISWMQEISEANH